MKPVPKLCGADIELGNFILGLDRFGGTCHEASRALLREINGISKEQFSGSYTTEYTQYDDSRGSRTCGNRALARDMPEEYSTSLSQDWGRKFLPGNGGCAYIDMDHLELCLPEVLSAFDHVACWHAMLRIGRKALEAANRKLRTGQKIQVLVNNSDGLGHSYGSHLNFLVARNAWDNLYGRRLHYLLFLAAYQASNILISGQGKVGSENGMPPVDFQISQRADFFERLVGPQTTFERPLVNSRDEPLCGSFYKRISAEHPAAQLARVHVVFFDNTLCQVASLLKVGVMQIILSMLEQERINPSLILEDPLDAVVTWSHDPALKARARMASGQMLTALELQFLFLEEAKRFVDSGACSDLVPRAAEIIHLWEDTLQKLEVWDADSLARRLDWVLKLTILRQALEGRPHLEWQSAQVKHLDQLYSSLDPRDGLFWLYSQNNFVERVVEDQQIEWFVHNPPDNTRAWARAMILRRMSADSADRVDWDTIRIKTRSKGGWSRFTELDMSNPLGFTKEASGHVFQNGLPLDDILEMLATQQNQCEAEESAGRPVIDTGKKHLLLVDGTELMGESRRLTPTNHDGKKKGIA